MKCTVCNKKRKLAEMYNCFGCGECVCGYCSYTHEQGCHHDDPDYGAMESEQNFEDALYGFTD